jgi:hypothetical protein
MGGASVVRRRKWLISPVSILAVGLLLFFLVPPAMFLPISQGVPTVGARSRCAILESTDVCGPRFLLRISFVLLAAIVAAILLGLYSGTGAPSHARPWRRRSLLQRMKLITAGNRRGA